MLIKKLLLLPLLANKQTVPQSTQLLSLNHAVSPSHAHSNTLSLKCLFFLRGSTTLPTCDLCYFKTDSILQINSSSYFLIFRIQTDWWLTLYQLTTMYVIKNTDSGCLRVLKDIFRSRR